MLLSIKDFMLTMTSPSSSGHFSRECPQGGGAFGGGGGGGGKSCYVSLLLFYHLSTKLTHLCINLELR